LVNQATPTNAMLNAPCKVGSSKRRMGVVRVGRRYLVHKRMCKVLKWHVSAYTTNVTHVYA